VKRLLAYSSIEHTGLACLSLGLGPAGVFAALLHLVNHTAAKSMLFLLSGRILARYGSAELDRVSGLARAMPVTAGMFAVGMVALMGLPPFGVFVSKFAIVRAGFAQGRPGLMALVLGLLVVAFAGLLIPLGRVLWGSAPGDVPRGEGGAWALVPLGGCVALLVLTGLLLPGPLGALLANAVAAVAP
jgi:hydrogenase-4 component F